MSIQEIQNALVQKFTSLATWEERYRYLMSLGPLLPKYPDEFRLDKFKVKGCQSQVWLHSKMHDGKIFYDVDSDALIVKGLAAILYQVFNNQTPDDIGAAPLDFISAIGLTQHLSQNRANGLAAMVKQFKNDALVHKMITAR